MADLGFKVLNKIPHGLLDVDASDLLDLLGGPTLIHLEGKRKYALFVSIMLHGNEYTGLLVIQRLLKKYIDAEWPRR